MTTRNTSHITIPHDINALRTYNFTALPKPKGPGNAHCPRCGAPAIKNGSTRAYKNANGKPSKRVQKYRCPECKLSFNANTSLEAINTRVENAKTILNFLLSGDSERSISSRLGVSIYKVRKIVSAFVNRIKVITSRNPLIDAGPVVIYIDEASSGVNGKCIIAAKVNDYDYLLVADGRNFLTIYSALMHIRENIASPDERDIIVVTDGYESYIDAVRAVFPHAIHIRQFHTARGVIYVHFRHDEELYTLVLRWDVVLNCHVKSKLGESTLRKRIWKGKKRNVHKGSHGRSWQVMVTLIDTPLADAKTCYLYRGIKRHPRRKRGVRGDERRVKRRRRRSGRKKSCRGRSKRPKLIATGNIDDILPNHPQVWRPYLAIMSHFGGKYITSNWAEWEFQFKLWLRTRHGIKSGDEMILMHFIGYRYNLQSSGVRRDAIIDLVCKSPIF